MSNRTGCKENTSVVMGWFLKRHSTSTFFCLHCYAYNSDGASLKAKQQGLNTQTHTWATVLPTQIHFNSSTEFRFIMTAVRAVRWKSALCNVPRAEHKKEAYLVLHVLTAHRGRFTERSWWASQVIWSWLWMLRKICLPVLEKSVSHHGGYGSCQLGTSWSEPVPQVPSCHTLHGAVHALLDVPELQHSSYS